MTFKDELPVDAELSDGTKVTIESYVEGQMTPPTDYDVMSRGLDIYSQVYRPTQFHARMPDGSQRVFDTLTIEIQTTGKPKYFLS